MSVCATTGCPALPRPGSTLCPVHDRREIYECAECKRGLAALDVTRRPADDRNDARLEHRDGRNRPCGPVTRKASVPA